MSRRHRFHLAALGAPLCLAAACGNGSEADAIDAGPEGDAAVADADRPADAEPPDLDPFYVVTGDTQWTAARGGEGGDGSREFRLICPTGHVAVALEGSAGSLVDSVALGCRELLPDGSLGDELHRTAEAGEANGSQYSFACDDGEAIVGIRGREGDELDALGIDCAPVVPWVDEGRGHAVGDEVAGGSGGEPFFDLCSRGFFVAELSGHDEDIIYGLRARCDRAADEHGIAPSHRYEIGSATEDLPPRGGPEERPVQIDCGGDLILGYRGRAGSRLDELQLVCGSLAEDGGLADSGTSTVIGGGGGDEFEALCPEGEAIVGIRGRAGSEIDAIGLLCAPVAAGWADDHTGVHPWGRLRGGSGGDAFDDVCPEGMFLSRVQAFSDQVIEAMTGICVDVVVLDESSALARGLHRFDR